MNNRKAILCDEFWEEENVEYTTVQLVAVMP